MYKESETVYVLNQKLNSGVICTSVFSKFDSCVKSALNEIEIHNTEHDLDKAEKELREQSYYFDGATEYFIEECIINED